MPRSHARRLLKVADGPAYVLVVDDDPINRALLAKSLEREGHEHAMAEHGREALEKLRAEAFDIVLLDVVMPELDGYEVLRRIEDDPDLRHVPVIMISAVEDLDSVVRCIELGADDYLPKPFDPVLLRARINGCLMKKRLHDLERERVRDVFSRFVPEPVVDEVLRRTDDDLRLRGVRVTGTVLFGDLRGFTSFAETIPADEVIEVLNDYLSRMSDAILDSGGTLVAYQGDGIMAVFGAPIETDDHADRALAAARDMLSERLPRFNRNLKENGLGDGFRMGIGLNSGPLMSGTVGSLRRLEYAAIGDTTNTASRLQAMTKGTPHSLLIAESTRELLRRPSDDLVFVDERDVPGRRARIRLWTLESTTGVREENGFATAGAATAPHRTSSG
jgi:adenylate cyclase